jgi:hypothetical protein
VLLSFDVDNETVSPLWEPPSAPCRAGNTGRVAPKRIVTCWIATAFLSFFIPAMSLMIAPQQVDIIKKSGRHEFAVHGWIHEMNTTSYPVERDLVKVPSTPPA